MATERVNFKLVVDTSGVRRAMRQVQQVAMQMGIPLHRADVPVDSCSAALGYPHAPGYVTCSVTAGGKHRAEVS